MVHSMYYCIIRQVSFRQIEPKLLLTRNILFKSGRCTVGQVIINPPVPAEVLSSHKNVVVRLLIKLQRFKW